MEGVDFLIVFIGVVVSVAVTVAVAYTSLREANTHTNPKLSVKELLKLCENLDNLSSVSLPYSLNVEVEPAQLVIRFDGGSFSFKITRVLLVQNSSLPSIEFNSTSLWHLWGNSTHSGLISWVRIVVDNHGAVVISYVNSTARSPVERIYFREGGRIVMSFPLNDVEVYVNNVKVLEVAETKRIEIREWVLEG